MTSTVVPAPISLFIKMQPLCISISLAANNGPKLILLDEPVANMDDLHLLNLLDVISYFALLGHQIFFTTASPDVANLFRRKFSFFLNDFKHFEFIRSGEKLVEIIEIHYDPNKEIGISNMS